jgi:hypothetical protein
MVICFWFQCSQMVVQEDQTHATVPSLVVDISKVNSMVYIFYYVCKRLFLKLNLHLVL